MGWEEVRYGCIGEHLGHSFSREIHTMLGDYDYRLCELAPEEVESFLLAKKFCGINVTIPYKQTVIPYLDEVDPAARRIGAVNTVLHKNGKLIGYNTDYYGMRALLLRAGIDLRGQQVAILGSGGTSATAWAVAQDAGAAGIVRVSRHPKKEGDEIGYAELYRRADRIGAIINTTPVGMFPHEEGLAVDPTAFAHLCGVADAVYHPLCTSLVCRAATMGIPATGGLYMLVAQAAKAAELFFDDLSMTEKTEAVFQRILWQKQNIVLIGMPGSGKSTLLHMLISSIVMNYSPNDVEIWLNEAFERTIISRQKATFKRSWIVLSGMAQIAVLSFARKINWFSCHHLSMLKIFGYVNSRVFSIFERISAQVFLKSVICVSEYCAVFTEASQTRNGFISYANDEIPWFAHTSSVVPLPEKGSKTHFGV